MAYCSNCGTEVSGAFCARCGMGVDGSAPVAPQAQGALTAIQLAELSRAREKHGVPALLSFFIPGLGQLVKGHAGKGILFFIGLGASAAIGVALPILWLAVPFIWIVQIYDAYTSNSS